MIERLVTKGVANLIFATGAMGMPQASISIDGRGAFSHSGACPGRSCVICTKLAPMFAPAIARE